MSYNFKHLIDNVKKSFQNKTLVSSFSKLATGTAIAQVIGILSIPILTRMYSVEAYGIQAVYNLSLIHI